MNQGSIFNCGFALVMNKRFISLFLLIFTLMGMMACQEKKAVSKQVKVELQSPFWSFNTSRTAKSSLSGTVPEAGLLLSDDQSKGFTIRFTADIKSVAREQTLLEIPQVLKVYLRKHDPDDRKIQNYPAYKMLDGSVPVLEASLSLQSPWDPKKFQDMTVGIPLAILDRPEGKHDIILQFSGVQWTIYIDGRLYDNDFALGYPLASRMKLWNLNPDYVSEANLYEPAIQPEQIAAPTPQIASNIQYWTPPYHNAWVGDVVTFFHDGRYHVFYLFDRRGHASKFGRGGHYFEHLSTTDFQTWVEHKPATPLEYQWETFGTGTPFLFNDKLCISYGLHTTRIYPKEETTLPMQWTYLEKNGYTGSFNYDTIQGLVPAGSTYSISEDGVTNFKKTHILYHPCENPSIYTDPDGNLKMLANYGARGTWKADSVNGGWKCLDADFPLGGDCTFFFRWGEYDYIIGGFTRLWSKLAKDPEFAYKDVVIEGADFYNGLSVPAITEIPGGRFLMAGWLKMQNWGGPLVIHELIQYPDGRIGTEWMDEIIPAMGTPKKLSAKLTGTGDFPVSSKSFMLTFKVYPDQPRQGNLKVLFLPEKGEESACEWQLQLDKARAQYGTNLTATYASSEKTLREGGAPQTASNYAIENGIDTSKPFMVRILVDGSDKFGGSLIDTEIAAQRTMISYRPELTVGNLRFCMEGISVQDISLAPLND